MKNSHRRYDIDDLLPSYQNIGREERLLSAGIGAAMLGAGLVRRSVGGAVLAAAGTVMIARGWTGYCAVLDGLGIDRSDPRPRAPLRTPTLPNEDRAQPGGQAVRDNSLEPTDAEDWSPAEA